MDPDRLLSKTEVAHQIRMCVRSLEALMNDGYIRYFKIGKTVRFSPQAVRDCLAKLEIERNGKEASND